MSIFIIVVSVLNSFAISLGVGSSTLAITNFFAAIADGKIDETERRMMGIVYVVLRVAMTTILFTSIGLLGVDIYHGTTSIASLATLTVLGVLFVNAILMTMRIMPSTFGPAFQAGSWYTLGALSALSGIGIVVSNYFIFFMSYITWLVLAVAIVNGMMALLKAIRYGAIK